jgi:hypothetical protein
MSTIQAAAGSGLTSLAASPQLPAQVRVQMFRIPMTGLVSIRDSISFARLTNGIFCLSLWISLLAAIWVSRGWIGLFFSGQVLSTVTYLFQRILKRTQYAFCANNRTSHEFEGE